MFPEAQSFMAEQFTGIATDKVDRVNLSYLNYNK